MPASTMERSSWSIIVGGFCFANAPNLSGLESTMFGEVLHIHDGELIKKVFPSWIVPLSVFKIS